MTTNNLRVLFSGSAVFILLLFGNGYASWVASTKPIADEANAKAATVAKQQNDIRIAEARFKNGCQLIGDNENQYVAITQGMKVHGTGNVNNHAPLPDGAVICDRFGGTAVIRDGAAAEYAASPNMAGYGQ